MSISDRIPYAAIALHQRVAFLEHQIAELGALRHRSMQVATLPVEVVPPSFRKIAHTPSQ